MINLTKLSLLLLAVVSFSARGQTSQKTAVQLETAIFSAGCFWCIQHPFDELKSAGVSSAVVGYTGGHTPNPTYPEVSAGGTGHRESIEVKFDPQRISYEKLLTIFWQNIDPYDANGQFCDKGESYKSTIYYTSESQKKLAEQSIINLQRSGKLKGKVATQILPAKPFFPAEDYHQEYYQKNPIRYKFYRYSCGRDKRLKEVWGQ